MLKTVIFALATTAPDGSVNVPRMPAEMSYANAVPAATQSSATTAALNRRK
jgi:hypothetical protein